MASYARPRRKFPIALLVPNFDRLEVWARAQGQSWADQESLVALPAVQTLLADEARKNLRDFAQYEVPKKFLILSRDFSIEGGELTPKLSVRRRIVEERHRQSIDALYAEPLPTPPDEVPVS